MALSLLQKRADASTTSNASSTSAAGQPENASQDDPLLARLSESTSSIQDSVSDVQDDSEATTIMNSLLQSMTTQAGTALSSHANQMPGNVLSLLQAAD